MIDPAIESVDVSAYTVPTDAPEADGTITWDSTTLVMVQIRAGRTVGTGWTYAHRSSAVLISDILAPVVRGRDALDVGALSDAMVKAVRNIGRPGIASYAIAAVDVALWDLKARLLELPLHRLLGAVRTQVPIYGSGGFTTYDAGQLERQLTGWTDQNIPRVKIKVGESWGTNPHRDLARMQQSRKVIGDEVELFVDANGGYGRKQAIRMMRAASELDVRWLEEPVSSDDLEGLREVRAAVDGRCHGRRVRQRPDLLPPDVPGRCRGLPAGRRVALRRHHRVASGRSRRGCLRPGDLWPLWAAPACPRRCRNSQPASPGVVPRPCADRDDVLRRHPGPRWRRPHPGRRRPGERADPADGRRRPVPGPLRPHGLLVGTS